MEQLDFDKPTKDELAKIKKGEQAAKNKLSGREWQEWLLIAEALEAGRCIAQRRANTNAREGKGYCMAFSAWLDEPDHKHLRMSSSTSVMTYLDKVWHNREAVEAWRNTLTAEQRLSWNHPQTVWTYYEKHNVVPTQENGDEGDGEGGEDGAESNAKSQTSENDPRPRKKLSQGTVEFVEWAVNAIDEDRLSIPTVISWLEELDIDAAIEALREYAENCKESESAY